MQEEGIARGPQRFSFFRASIRQDLRSLLRCLPSTVRVRPVLIRAKGVYIPTGGNSPENRNGTTWIDMEALTRIVK